MKITYKDKILLILLVAAITLTASFMLLIKPKMDDITSNKEAVKAAELKENDIKSKISKSKITSLKKSVDDYIAKSEDANKTFLPQKTNYDVDRFIQGVINADPANPITITPLTIKGPLTTDLSKYDGFSPNSALDPSKSADINKKTDSKTDTTTDSKSDTSTDLTNNSAKDKSTAGSGSNNSFQACTIEIGYKCSLGAVEKFLSRLTADKGMSVIVNEFTLGYEADTTQPAGVDEKTGQPIYKKLEGHLVSGNIKMTIYFLEPKQFTAPKE